MESWQDDVVTTSRARVPLVVAALVALATVLLSWQGTHQLGAAPSFVPIWLALVAVFDVITVVLLTQQYRGGGSPRLLVLGWAYALSSVLTLAVVATIGGVLTGQGLLGDDGTHAIWLMLARLVVGPGLVALALVPWSDRFDAWLRDPDGRTARTLGTVLATVGVAVVVMLVVLHEPVPLPRITQSLNGAIVLTTGVNRALVAATVLTLVVGLAGVASRRRVQGLEAWALVALTASAGGTVLTLVSAAPYDVAWFGARALGVTATFMVLTGLLQDANHLQVRVRGYARQLEQRNLDLTEAQSLRDHLVAVVSHDMRNPLAGIAGYLELLSDGPDLSDSDVERIHTRARLLTRRLTLLTEDLLASASTQELTLLSRRLMLREELDECAAGFPDVDVVVRCPVDLQVDADALRLQQVLSNLVTNAQRYGAAPIRVTALSVAGAVRIVVSDAGPGVPADFVPLLFERHTRADPTSAQGSGLGLALSRRLVERHDGTLDYEPETGDFVVLLPGVRAPRSSAGLSRARIARATSCTSLSSEPADTDPVAG